MKTNWQTKKLGEVILDIKDGGTPSRKKPEYFDGDIFWCVVRDIKPFIYETKEKLTQAGLKHSSAKLWPVNSVIISLGATIGQVGISKVPVATKQGISGIVVDQRIIIPEYLVYVLNGKKDFIQSIAKGTTIKEVRPSALKDKLILPLPSISEQKRIVKKLDEVFEKIEKVKENAEKNLQNSKELFESYLQNIFTNPGKGWERKTLKELTTHLGDGLHGTPKYTINGDYYFINGSNLSDGIIEFKSNTKKVSIDEYNKYKKNLTDRTILVSINGTLGNVAFYNNEKIILGKSACYFNINENVDKNYIKYVLSSPYFLTYAYKEATGATIKNVSLKTMREFIIPLPSLKEQKTIVKKLDSLSKQTKKLEKIYEQKLADLEELKRSILNKAFKGEL